MKQVRAMKIHEMKTGVVEHHGFSVRYKQSTAVPPFLVSLLLDLPSFNLVSYMLAVPLHILIN